MLSPILAMCQLAMWAENSVKIELNSVIKTKRKPSKNKEGMEWKTIKMSQNVESVNKK